MYINLKKYYAQPRFGKTEFPSYNSDEQKPLSPSLKRVWKIKMETRDIFFILTTLLIQSCADHSSNDRSKKNLQDSSNSISALMQNDSLTDKDWRLSEIENILPQWPHSSLTLESVKTINANVFSVFCKQSDGVSMTTYVFTFNNNKIKDYEILVYNADQDLSSPRDYTYKELRDSTDNKFIVVGYIQSLNGKNVLTKDGDFKTGFNFENVIIKIDSTLTRLVILNDGQIRRDTLK